MTCSSNGCRADGLVTAAEWILVTPRIHHTHHGYGRDGKAPIAISVRCSASTIACSERFTSPKAAWRATDCPGGEHVWWRQLLFPLRPLGESRKR